MASAFLRRCAGIFVATFLSGCGANHNVTPLRHDASDSSGAIVVAGSPYQAIPNLFSAAVGKTLSEADIDRYIDPSVIGHDRLLAHEFMKMMPSNLRGDFAYLGPGQHVFSNNPKLLRYITVAAQHNMPSTANASTRGSVLRRRMDYSSSCSPPNPPNNPMGGYIRQVSQCGFTAGFAFLYVPCGYSSFYNNDAGYLYFELQGKSGSLTEGGLQYNQDLSVAPWLKPPNGQVFMNNNNVRYTCGENLGILFGATQSGAYTYTSVGIVPSSCQPQTSFCNQNAFTFTGQSWLFEPSAGDIVGTGYDADGKYTPCLQCSISKLTTLAQNVSTYSIDGSYFGVNHSTGQNMINWMQVAFGEWESDCTPGTSLCTGDYSAYPPIYYGGPQSYPNDLISQSNINPNSGYGPYESFDSVDLSCGGCSSTRSAAGAFREPLPPPPCSPDVQGYCANQQSVSNANPYFCLINGKEYQFYGTITTRYQVWQGSIYKENTIKTTTSTGCPYNPKSSWSPGDPAVQYNDKNLP